MTTSSTVIDRFMSAIEAGAIPDDIFSEDAVLDATVPNWRFSKSGRQAVQAELSSWYADPGHFASVRRQAFSEGELVEFDLTWEENGVPHACHQAHILKLSGTHILTDTAFCGGRWPAHLIAEMREAATT